MIPKKVKIFIILHSPNNAGKIIDQEKEDYTASFYKDRGVEDPGRGRAPTITGKLLKTVVEGIVGLGEEEKEKVK